MTPAVPEKGAGPGCTAPGALSSCGPCTGTTQTLTPSQRPAREQSTRWPDTPGRGKSLPLSRGWWGTTSIRQRGPEEDTLPSRVRSVFQPPTLICMKIETLLPIKRQRPKPHPMRSREGSCRVLSLFPGKYEHGHETRPSAHREVVRETAALVKRAAPSLPRARQPETPNTWSFSWWNIDLACNANRPPQPCAESKLIVKPVHTRGSRDQQRAD